MPKIEVYKGNGCMIPVSNAKQTKAYQCPWTNKLYANKKSYVAHLKDLRENRMHKRAREIRHNRLGENLWSQPTFEKIIEWIELHPEWFIKKSNRWNWKENEFEKILQIFSIKITYLEMRWNDNVSNTHSCPHNGVTNWGGKNEDAPCGYPGWSGKIEYEISHQIPTFGSDLMKGSRIHIGSGGGNGLNYGYGVELFADDWPELYKNHKQEMVENALQDDINYTTFKYGKKKYFRW